MITPKILSDKVSYFLSKENWSEEDRRYVFKLFYFTGEEIVACDTHWLVRVKNVRKGEHYENKDGYPVTTVWPYPNYKRVLLQEESVGWQEKFLTTPGSGFYLNLKRAKQLFTFLRSATKNGPGPGPMVCLEKIGEELTAYAVSPEYYMRFDLTSSVGSGFDWAGVFSLNYLAAAFDLLEASKPDTLTIRAEKQPKRRGPQLVLETEDLYILCTPMNVGSYAGSKFTKKG